MLFGGRSALASVFLVLAAAQQGMAVCASGQMAVGTEMLEMFTGPARSFLEYSGFLMTNHCKTISQNGLTQDTKQMCSGGYLKGASVSCDSHGNPTSAVDTTQGQHWTCSPTSDSSCDVGGSGGRFHVVACCSRK